MVGVHEDGLCSQRKKHAVWTGEARRPKRACTSLRRAAAKLPPVATASGPYRQFKLEPALALGSTACPPPPRVYHPPKDT